MKLLCGLLVALSGHFLYTLLFGAAGVTALRGLNADIEVTREANAAQLARNERLAIEIEDLKNGLEAVEERARFELGMIAAGETFYLIVEP